MKRMSMDDMKYYVELFDDLATQLMHENPIILNKDKSSKEYKKQSIS